MALEKFHHKTPHGELVVTKFQDLPMGFFRKTRRMSQAESANALLELLEDLLTEKGLATLDKLNREQFGEFIAAWKDDSGVGLGESSASSTS